MNDLLFYLTILALLYYYFFYYRPSKTLHPDPTKLTHSQSTQTETNSPPPSADNPELETQVDHLIQEIQSLCSKIN